MQPHDRCWRHVPLDALDALQHQQFRSICKQHRDIAARIEPCQTLADEIGRCISEQGEVSDQASAKLARLRRELHQLVAGMAQEVLFRPCCLQPRLGLALLAS